MDEGKYVVSGTPKGLINSTEGTQKLEDVFLHYTGHSVRD
jgi:ABC-2 type transport system ATP-binding protein